MSILETLALRRAKQPQAGLLVEDNPPAAPQPTDEDASHEARIALSEQLERMIRDAKKSLAIESEPAPAIAEAPQAAPVTFEPPAEVDVATDDESPDVSEDEGVEAPIDGEISAILDAEPAASAAREPPPREDVRRFSERSARTNAVASLHGALEGQLRNISEVLALSQRTWASAQPHLEAFELDAKRLDMLEGEVATREREVQGLRRANQELSKSLSVKEAEINVALARYNDACAEADKLRRRLAESDGEHSRLVSDLNKAESAISQFRGDIALVTSQYERESVAKENAERARSELERKYATLQAAEASARSKLAEISLQHEKLTDQVPALIQEYETLQRELHAAHRNGADLEARYLSARDRVTLLENEIRLSESQSAATAFAARNEVEMARSQLRTAHEAAAELELRMKEMQARLGVNETWRQKVEQEMALLERDAQNARREAEAAVATVSELNLRYTTDLLTIDQLRDQNRQLQQTLESVQADNQRLSKFESLYRSAESQVSSLRMRLDSLFKAAQNGGDPSLDATATSSVSDAAVEPAPAEKNNVMELKDAKNSKPKPRQA